MNNYKIVASDLDDTLYGEDSAVSKENTEAIRTLREKGVIFAPATGRAFGDIMENLRDNEDIRYFICSNGAMLFDKQTGRSVLRCIPADIIKQVLDILYRFDVNISVRTDGFCFTASETYGEEKFKFYNFCDAHANVLRAYAKVLNDFKNWAYSLDHAESFSIFFHNLDDLFECKRLLSSMTELNVLRQFEHNLELFSSKTSKGDALMSLAELIGASREETIAVGDSNNDLSMIETAGLGLAVANASDSLKSVADEVICSNEEHAIDYIVKHYFE